jgi:hypothetical protein
VQIVHRSGMTLMHCAAAAKVSKHSLRRLRDLIKRGDVATDWRARLHKIIAPPLRGINRTVDVGPRGAVLCATITPTGLSTGA